MDEQLAAAIRLREAGRKEEALALLQQLQRAAPDDARINYQCAWTCDSLGYEREAVPFYERALAHGLTGEDRRGAMLGLGSTYRTLGQYEQAIAVLRAGLAEFPDGREFAAFLAIALYNTGAHAEAMRLLLHTLAETTQDERLLGYRRALTFYADHLDEVW